MTNEYDKLQAELQALEDQIEAQRAQVRQAEGMEKVRREKQLTDLLLKQKDVQAKLEATAPSS